MRRLLQLSLFLSFFLGAHAEGLISKPAKPEIKHLGGSRHQIGKIVFDSKARTIEFGAALEQNEVLVEYLLVNPHGKIHESVFITDILPFNLNVAMKLLGYQESKELLPILDESHTPTGKLHPATPEQKAHSRFSVSVSWLADGKKITHSARELLVRKSAQEAAADSPWIYSGSYTLDGKYKPDLSGDILAIFTDSSAIANYSGEGHHDDTIWLPNKVLLPSFDTPVTITLTKTKPTDSP